MPKYIQNRTKGRQILAFFHQFLDRLNQLQCSATLIYSITFPSSTQMHNTSLAGCWYYSPAMSPLYPAPCCNLKIQGCLVCVFVCVCFSHFYMRFSQEHLYQALYFVASNLGLHCLSVPKEVTLYIISRN